MFATDPTVWESGECLVLVTGGETEVNDKRGGKRIRTFVVLKKIVVPWILLDCVVIVRVSKLLVGCSVLLLSSPKNVTSLLPF